VEDPCGGDKAESAVMLVVDIVVAEDAILDSMTAMEEFTACLEPDGGVRGRVLRQTEGGDSDGLARLALAKLRLQCVYESREEMDKHAAAVDSLVFDIPTAADPVRTVLNIVA
jgi:hypothetical protein